MKKQLLLLAFFIISTTTWSQDMASLKTGAEKIYMATLKLDYDTVLESTYPRVFDIVSREQIREILISTFKGNEEMKIKIITPEPDFSFGKIKKIGNQTFCLIKHNTVLELTLSEQIEDSKVFIKAIKKAMNPKTIVFDKESNSITVSLRSTMVGISDELTNNEWRFINKEKGNIVIGKIFNKTVIKELGL